MSSSNDQKPVPPEAVTVVMVAGPGDDVPQLHVVALDTGGEPWQYPVKEHETGRVFAPRSFLDEMNRALIQASQAPGPTDAAHVLGSAIRGATSSELGYVSLDWDHVIVTQSGTSATVEHVYSRSPLHERM